MSPEKKEFYGQDVPSAIKEACESLGVAQENLAIEVIETGSKGIFGLIRKKARIRVRVQQSPADQAPLFAPPPPAPPKPATNQRRSAVPVETIDPVQTQAPVDLPNNERTDSDDNGDDDEDTNREPVELSPETLAIIGDELRRILELMNCPSPVTVESEEGAVLCRVGEEHEEILTSQEGRTLDSLQYLLRKIVSRKLPGRIQLSIDVGTYRAKRHQELHDLALQYAAQVKENGKTQVIASLNPSERRVVHVSLQNDPEIRSRSIGEGLFKKVLIYKPGRPKRGNGRKRPRSSSRKRSSSRQE